MQAVSKEREEYKKAILSTWLPPTLPALDAMSGRQKSQVEEDVKQRQEAVARQYDRYWKFHSILPLKINNNNNINNINNNNNGDVGSKGEDSLFLATTGTLPVLQIPSSLDDGVPVSLPTTLSYLPATIAMNNNKTTNNISQQKTGLNSSGRKNAVVVERPYRKVAVTPLHQFVEDGHLLYRPSATTNNPPTLLISKSTITPGTIVADASALIAIASTPLMSHYQDRQLQKSWCWEIPITVDEEGRVIIEKPLHPRAVTKRALMTRLYKYAALSVLLPEPVEEAEEEEVGGEGSNGKWKAKQVKRSRSSANPASKRAPTQKSTQTTASPSPRQTMFGKVIVGEHLVLIRSHAMYHVPIESISLVDDDATKEKEKHGNTGGLVPAVFGVKSDYLDTTANGSGDGEVEEEIFSELEVCHWLLKLLFCPGAEGVMVARVHVPRSKLMSCEYLSRRELEENLDTAPCLDFLSTVLTDVKKQQLGAGRYILSPVGGQDNISIAVYTVSDDDKSAGGVGRGGGGSATAPGGGGTSTHITVLPLPCGGTTTTAAAMHQKQQHQQKRGKVVYDLHEALRLSGRMTILPQHAFLPPRWHPYRFGDDDDDDEGKEEVKMSQIPDTFPPRPTDGDGDTPREGRKNKKKGKGKKRRGDVDGGGEEGKKGRRKRKRQRRLLPHAWSVLGKGGDFDGLLDQQQKPMDMSRRNYMDQLEEEI